MQHTSNVLYYRDNKWKEPPQLKDRKNIKKVFFSNNRFTSMYALTEDGELITAGSTAASFFKGTHVREMELDKSSVWFVTEKGLFEKNFNSANVEQHYSGPALDVFVGDSHTILKTKTGYLSKGQNYYGQTARPQEDDESNEFKDATYLKSLKIEEIYVGGWHNYAKLTNGTFVGWGYDYGRLGGGTSNTHAIKPVPLKHHLLGMTKLVCGGWHTMGLTSSGRMYIWGIDAEGSLGQKQINVTLNEPTLLLDNIRMAFSGKRQLASFAVRNDGEVLVWGKNNNSCLGLEGQILVPTPVKPLLKLPIGGFTITDDYVCVVLNSKKIFEVKNHKQFADVAVIVQNK